MYQSAMPCNSSHKPASTLYNKRLMAALCCVVLCVLAVFTAQLAHATPSQPFTLDAASSGKSVNAYVDYFIDNSDQMTVEEVAASANFIPTEGRAGFSPSMHPLWLRLRLERAADMQPRWLIELQPFYVNEISFYAPDGKGGFTRKTSGGDYPFSTREIEYRQYVYPVDLSTEGTMTLYWRIQSPAALGIPVSVWRSVDWSNSVLIQYAFFGLCFGVMLGLALYNLLIYIRVCDNLFLLYFCMIASFTVFAADYIGLADHLIWPADSAPWSGRSPALSNLYGIFIVLFARRLLDSPQLSIWFSRFMLLVAGLYGVGVMAALAGYPIVAGILTQYLTAAWLLPVLLVAVWRTHQGFWPASFFLIGYGPLLVFLGVWVLIAENVLEANFVTQYGAIAAGAWEAIFFSQALAERLNALKRERELALKMVLQTQQEKLLESQKHEAELECKVVERTARLEEEAQAHQQTIEQLQASERLLANMAYRDPLTNLPNRRMFNDQFAYCLSAAKRHGDSFALVLLDLDRFKEVNDTVGHDAGDAVLIEVAKRLQGAVRSLDMVVRHGGDEFALLLVAPVTEAEVASIIQRVFAAFSAPLHFAGQSLSINSSAGVALYPRDGLDQKQLYKSADTALYAAKAAGTNMCRVFNQSSGEVQSAPLV